MQAHCSTLSPKRLQTNSYSLIYLVRFQEPDKLVQLRSSMPSLECISDKVRNAREGAGSFLQWLPSLRQPTTGYLPVSSTAQRAMFGPSPQSPKCFGYHVLGQLGCRDKGNMDEEASKYLILTLLLSPEAWISEVRNHHGTGDNAVTTGGWSGE